MIALYHNMVTDPIFHLEQTQNAWLEPMREWIKEAQTIGAIARNDDLFAKKVIAKKIFGSNLRLGTRNLTLESISEGGNVLKTKEETHWAAFVAAREKFLRCPEMDVCMMLVAPWGFEPQFSG